MSNPEAEDKLVFLWSTAERDVALTMIFMYLLNASRKIGEKKSP